MKIISYNVNGLRSARAKGLLDWLAATQADVVCLQEIKLQPEQLDLEELRALGYHTYLHTAQRRGYSGVAILSRQEPDRLEYGIGVEEIDCEGRSLTAHWGALTVVCVYLPSGSSGAERIAYKMRTHLAWQAYIEHLMGRHHEIIVCGDLNVAHQSTDIHDPIRLSRVSGFLPEERDWLTNFLALGYVDAWRYLHPQEVQYSWWSYRSRARQNNKGWRIDYALLSRALLPRLEQAELCTDVVLSDHCPLVLLLSDRPTNFPNINAHLLA